ncbi:hypothetical protein MKW94_017245 [Papaver nudicaule]|uniref:RRM domain-containing protein n=1 Tax=Papaver nudicaule TaxID=74823 RepID=A0AA41VUN7_PAPNU|nr:hypothetical protein [Papaver nudicaule]
MAKKRRVEDEEDTDPEMDSSEEEEVEENEEESAEEEEEDSEKSLEEPEPESASSEEDLSELLEPLPKEKLIDIIRLASVENKKLISDIHKIADSDPSHRKLFVHGLGWETNSDKLREIFSVYGELEDCNIVVDKNTGKSKGYGFILFKHRKSASKALKEPQKKIENRMTACQLASSGPVNIPSQQQHQHQQHQHQQQQFQQMNKKNGGNPGVPSQQTQEMLQRKIYVANVHPEINGEKLHSFFSKFGEIEEGPLGFDKNTGKPKGFALFIYKTLEGAKKALEEPSKNFDGHVLHVQKATDNNKQKTGGSGSAPLPAGVMPAKNDGYNHVGNAGFNPQPGGPGFNPQNGVMGHPGLMMNHGLMGGVPQPYGQGMQPVQAALAVLAAAGQNPAAFGMMNPALAGFNPAMVPPFGMGNPMYPNPQGPYQVGPSGQGPAKRPALGPTGGYSAR